MTGRILRTLHDEKTGTNLHAVCQSPDRFERLVLTAPATAWEARANQVGMYERMAAMLETSSPEAIAAVLSQLPVPSIFADVSGYLLLPDVRLAALPTVLRRAGSSNLPQREQLARITQPTLIFSWATDPAHAVAVAEELARILPNAQLHVSTIVADVSTWGSGPPRFIPRNDEVWSNWSLEGEQKSHFRHLKTILLQGYLSLCTSITRSLIPVAKPKMMLILNLHAFISSVSMLLGKLGASSRTQAISQAHTRSPL